jgi:flagellar hook-basal body complex protein FliE
MSSGIASLIQTDLASLTSAAENLADSSVAAANLYGNAQAATTFTQSMTDAVNKVNQDDATSSQLAADVSSGKSDDLVGAMLSSQQASLSFSMLMQVRNKVMGAVDDLIKLPL